MQLTNYMAVTQFTAITPETVDNITDEAIKHEMLDSATANAHRDRYPEQFNPPPHILENMARTALAAEPVAEEMLAGGFGWDITSGYRCPKLNADVGGVSNSAHVVALALDVRFTSPAHAIALVKAFIKAGFKRIGLGNTFIHADLSTVLPTPMVWEYSKKHKTPDWLKAYIPEFLQLIQDLNTPDVDVTPPINSTPVIQPPSTRKTITVKSGQGPWSVAKDAGISIQNLVKYNRKVFPKGLTPGTYMLHPGDKLFIEA